MYYIGSKCVYMPYMHFCELALLHAICRETCIQCDPGWLSQWHWRLCNDIHWQQLETPCNTPLLLDECTCRGGVPSAWLPGRSGSLQQHKGIQVRDCLFDIIIISAGQINLLVRYIYTELIILMDVYSMYVLLVSYHHRPCKLPSKLGIPLIGKGTRWMHPCLSLLKVWLCV